MESHKLLVVSLLVIQLVGCATARDISNIKHHKKNVEVRVQSEKTGKQVLQWQSPPGYSGSLDIHESCKYFVPDWPLFGPWEKTKKFVEAGSGYTNLYPVKPNDATILISEFSKLKVDSCRFLVYGEMDCADICSGPFGIHVVNDKGGAC